MSTTARTLIRGALRKLMALELGQSVDPNEEQDALLELNDMLAQFSNESLLIPVETQITFALTAGVNSYTIGTGQNINTVKPIEITSAYYKIASGSTTLDTGLNIVSQDEYESHYDKSVQSIPQELSYYNNLNSASAKIYLYPTPPAADTLLLYIRQPLTSIVNLTDTINLDIRYNQYLKLMLARLLAPEYGLQFSQDLTMQLMKVENTIKRANLNTPQARFDVSGLSTNINRYYKGWQRS